ncbi:MAG: diaminopimelate decarboxylase [Ginsengibacter sp.]|jgi:diaminopimelate decarboxylase
MNEVLSHRQLSEIAQEYGTPVYIYHAEKIAAQYQKLLTAFKGQDIRFFYASKALTNLNVLNYIRGLGANVDCSSINEAKMAIHAGFSPTNILYTSNGINFEEIAEAKELGISINIDSLSNLDKFGEAYGNSYPVGIRLRPNILAGGNLKISTGHDKSKFGIPVDQVNRILEIVEKHQLNIKTLHIHTGSEIKDVEVFVQGIDILFQLAHDFKDLKVIDLGGGFKVPYKEGDSETDINLLAEKVQSAFQKHEEDTGRHLQVWFEPGKFMVSECGYFVAEVNVLKETSATTFVSVNSGFNHLIRPMFYDAYHKIENISNTGGKSEKYTVVGNICETDTFAWQREFSETKEGDLLAFYNAGAYGFEMASNFNSRFRPAEVMVKEGKPFLIRRRETFEDLLRNQVFDKKGNS